MSFRLFQWGKPLMPHPFWSEERKRFFADQYGGEDSPEYKHNVLGEDGDPEHTVFPWHQFRYCIRDVPEYRALKILVEASAGEVIVTGYRCPYRANENGAIPQQEYLLNSIERLSTFFDFDEAGENGFTRLLKSYFGGVPGLKRGGGDFGYSGDVTELYIKNIIGKRDRLVGRLQLKHVTYDQQCQALNALDDVYGPMESISWGTDYGNAGSAVAHDLQGLELYRDKRFDDRLMGFQFESTTENRDVEGNIIVDAMTEKPAKITLKELATDILVKKMQRQELEYPPDPDIVLAYTNHTVRSGGKHRIFRKEDDHLIDADRVQILAGMLGAETEDLFA